MEKCHKDFIYRSDSADQLCKTLNNFSCGLAIFRLMENRIVPIYCNPSFYKIMEYTEEYFQSAEQEMFFGNVHPEDLPLLREKIDDSLKTGEPVRGTFRIWSKQKEDYHWIHMDGTIKISPQFTEFYAVFNNVSAEIPLLQSIADEMADAIYVIDKKTYNLLYANESKVMFQNKRDYTGQKCYAALHGKDAPCSFCTLTSHAPDGLPHPMPLENDSRFYTTRFKEIDWNGIPAYVKYIQDVTDDVLLQKEKDRLEQYFQTVLRYLPGGIAVVRHEKDGSMIPEFLSDGFAKMVDMSPEEAWALYQQNALSGVHPDDWDYIREHLNQCISTGQERYEMIYRLKKGSSGYLWVKAVFSVIQTEGTDTRVYVDYNDITKEREAQELLQRQYQELILQHYLTPSPNTLILGHCNITQNRISEVIDRTNSHLLETFGSVRENFFAGISSFIVDRGEQQIFLDTYLNAPTADAFERGETELVRSCYVKLPSESAGRYVQFKVNLVETPNTGDITGILSVTDITNQTISDQIMRHLSVASYDFIADVDFIHDRYSVISGMAAENETGKHGSYSQKMKLLIQRHTVPREQEHVAQMLDSAYLTERLEQEGSFSFSYSIAREKNEILTKNLTISAIDLRLGRICIAQTDITESVREQRGLLSMLAYTFELACFINRDTGVLTMHTRETVLKNLPPYTAQNYNQVAARFSQNYGAAENKEENSRQFLLETMLERLAETPSGYDFVFPYRGENGPLYKQVNVLWGDESHKTICLVRADVTDVLTAERQAKHDLEQALSLAEKANHAKSDFLSSMSHDIRTPMNAIMGMTTLALAHLNDKTRTSEYLKKISVASKHLLSLINDILDMSQIEQSKIHLNYMRSSIDGLIDQLSSIMISQARDTGLNFKIHTDKFQHPYFLGDMLRINQILINLLSNAFKFTPEGGQVELTVKEIPSKNGSDKVRYQFIIQDTGIGMSDEFQKHLFEPFLRSSGTEKVEGTGLGLSITKGLVELMDGTIQVKSQLHHGTTFRVELEFDTAPDGETGRSNPSEQQLSEAQVLSGRNFLVAEDNMINSEILIELLQMYGAKATVKGDGLQTVQEFQHTPPETYHAVLMDIQMPVMNGLEAARAIRQLNRPDAETIPIIAMTANAFAEDVQKSLEAGMNAHVAKPVDLHTLCEVLIKLLS